jgi:Na+/H+-dicarboxylate symporter
MKTRLLPAAWILIAMAIGTTLGYVIFASLPDKGAAAVLAAGYASFMSEMYDVALHLIKLLIGPLVFAALVVGIAHRGSGKPVWYVFAKALAWFSVVSLILGLVMANVLGDGLARALRCNDAVAHGTPCA